VKLVPAIVRYFYLENGVENYILDFSNLPGKTDELNHNKIVRVFEKILTQRKNNRFK
jgi:hypothetical protein